MIATDTQPALPGALVPQREIVYTTLDDIEGLKARALAKIIYHQARTEFDAVAVLGRDDAFYVMAKDKIASYRREELRGAIIHFESELDRSHYPDPLPLCFDPDKPKDEEAARIFGDSITRALWLGLRWRRIVNQYFNAHVESLAANIKKYQARGDFTRTNLANLFSYSSDIFGTTEPTSLVALRLFPYLTGERQFNLKIEVAKR